ncbi:putative polyphosphate/ATP-dependent NAD kinase [Microbacterium sp. W4I4]|uniref:ATP-NAD kinase family protein n=1 Tax=Microbacterium sp. W4I4 TaxID=3042295 RepID=UPI00278362DA|nr:NAD(+)/NADH kinase [Microbacterium sp. W4I4]MDQ0614295.1 putative polyphosphate/ATP-dependent NAD kinase [Microbacterium sp. W4I4]
MIGLVVNPVAGIGGPAGLAGSDGAEVQRLAVARGAHSRARERARIAMQVLAARRPSLVIATAADAMGADAVRSAGLVPWVVHSTESGPSSGMTAAADTSAAVAALAAAGAGLILVAGGDGTLRDAAAGLARTAAAPPAVLGIPAGVKMYSPVFAVSPRAAGALAAEWIDGVLPTADREVLDVDEVAMRHARVDPVLHGMLRVPFRIGRTQSRKAATPTSEVAAVAAAARGVVRRMRPDTRYLLGPGSTTAEIARQLGIRKSPLGVDVILDRRLLLAAGSEQQLLAEVAQGPAQAVVTVIGGQGFLLGRGNQQLSASVIRALGEDPLMVVAPEQKLIDLHGLPLIVETGDAEIDARLSGHIRIVTGVATTSLYAVAAPDTDL